MKWSGFSRILEAILALMLISIPMTTALLKHCIYGVKGGNELEELATQVLLEADKIGKLKEAVYNCDLHKMKSLIMDSLPPEVSVLVEVRDSHNRLIMELKRGQLNDDCVIVIKYVLTFRGAERIVIIKCSP